MPLATRILIAVLLAFPATAGPVHLFLVGDAGERLASVRPGATIGVNAWIFAPVDAVNGVDWKLSAPGFSLASTVRTDWSPFADPIVNSPTLTSDLGAVVDGDAIGAGLWPLMRLTLTAPSAPGIYTLMPTAAPGTGWVDRGFSDREFRSYGGMTIVVSNTAAAAVVPEPVAAIAVVIIGAWVLLGRYRNA
jgi:hypothetical protein